MLKELVNFVKRVEKTVDALGIDLKTSDDGLKLDVAGNTINATINGGKIRSIKIDKGENMSKIIEKVAEAIGEVCENYENGDVGDMLLHGVPTAAEVNPDKIIAIAQYGYPFLFGGNVIVGVLVKDRDKAPKFNDGEHWTQFSKDDTLFGVVKDIIGAGAPTLVELFNNRDSDKTDTTINIDTDWCTIRIRNIYPDAYNSCIDSPELAVTKPVIADVVNTLMNNINEKVGIVVGADTDISNDVITNIYASILHELKYEKGKSPYASFDVKRNGPERTINFGLRLAETVARVVYKTQLTYLTNTYQCGLIEGYPSEVEIRKQYDRQFADMDLDLKSKLMKLSMVTWDKE